MVYDDDTSRRVYYDLEGEARFDSHQPTTAAPVSRNDWDVVSRLARPFGWAADRVHVALRIEHNRHDIALAAVHAVLRDPHPGTGGR